MSRPDDSPKATSWITLGRVARPRGFRGEVLVDLLTDFPEHLAQLDRASLRFPNGQVESCRIESVWFHKGRAVVRFDGAQSYEDAQRVVRAEIQIPEDEAVKLPEGTYFDFQLVGCEVVTEAGLRVGRVQSILKVPGQSLLVIENGREVLIPAREPICRKVDLAARQIVISPPEGLLELNR